MSLLRFLRVRVARLLVRLAQKLDSAAAANRVLVTEKFEALRLRYPGAPDHWLELVAQRTPVAFAAPSIPAKREVSEVIPGQLHRGPAEPPAFELSAARSRTPVLFRGREQPSRRGPSANFSRFRGTRVEEQAKCAANQSQGHRQTFFQPVRRLAISLLAPAPSAAPQLRKRNVLKFHTRTTTPAPRAVTDCPLAPIRDRPDAISFTEARPRQLEWEPEFKTCAAEPRLLMEPQFGCPTPRRLNQLSWVAGNSAQMFHPAEFRPSSNEWPELPSVDDGDGPATTVPLNETALLAEQMGGRWSA